MTLFIVLVPIVAHVTRLDAPVAPPPPPPRVTTFYLSPDGDDGHDGSSPAMAWRSLARADRAFFMPGDRLLLQGGARFRGSLGLGPGEAGNASKPVVVESYGQGRATIEAIGYSAIAVHNTAGIEIRNLALVGDKYAFAAHGGIHLYGDVPGDRKFDHVVISQVDVTGFRWGIYIDGRRGATGFRHVRVSDAALHGNRDAGLISTGPAGDLTAPVYAHEKVTVTDVEAYDNRGDPADRWNTTGNGLVLGGVRGGRIERSVAHDNGSLCNSERGPVGIWAYDSTKVVIQHNVAYHNRTAGNADGGGFDFDRHVSRSIIQYNLSYENDGAGYLLYGPPTGGAAVDNIVRFNISHNDARKDPFYGGILLGGLVRGAQIYHNTVSITAHERGQPAALRVYGTLSGVTVRNNVLMSDGTVSVSAGKPFSPAEVLLQGNNLYEASAPALIRWGSESYASLSDWRSATGQERRGSSDTGLSVDPGFATGRRADHATAYVPGDRSPLVARALDLSTLFGVDPGRVDYFGRPVAGSAAIGAAQPASAR